MTHEDATRLFYAHIWPHRAMILRTAQFLTRHHAEADDLAQETLVKAFKSIALFDPNSNAKGWISAILRNTWIDHLRATGRHGTLLSVEEHDVDVPDHHAPAHEADTGDPAALLERFTDADMIKALHTLPEEIRWTLLLVDVESLDHAQAAIILGIPEGTVKSRAHRGRRMLRERLLVRNAPAGPDHSPPEDTP
jgi:RNA polymerase sigma-70 factor (ECF subfamily)